MVAVVEEELAERECMAVEIVIAVAAGEVLGFCGHGLVADATEW